MAKRTVVEWIDDIDGSAAAETVTFTIDGSRYEIDLSEENAAKLRKAMKRWVEAARRSGTKKARGTRPKEDPAESAKARKWALDNGFDVGPRGRLRSEVLDAFRSRPADK
ncbi:MAG: Lsr2 family protein [Mycobacterium sp.]